MTSRQVRPQYTEAPYRRGSKPSDERSLSAFVDEELKKIEQGFAVIRTQMSFTFDGSGFKLVGDLASPGPDMVYGTDGSGVKGWKAGSGGGGGAGPQGVPGRPGYDGVNGEDSYIPGPMGPAGAAGAAGAAGSPGRPGLDGLDGEDSYVPGPVGPQGPSGPSGASGSPGPALAYILDPIEPDIILIPGPKGDKGDTGATGGGGGGGLTFTTVEKDLGALPSYGGFFDITGLSSLTPAKPVLVTQAAGPYTGKGDGTDEAEMDLVLATGYVVDAATVRVFWQCPPKSGPVSGNIKFNYAISG